MTPGACIKHMVNCTCLKFLLQFHLQYNQVRKENLTPVEKSINNYLGDLLKQSDEIADNGYLYQQLQLDNAHPGMNITQYRHCASIMA